MSKAYTHTCTHPGCGKKFSSSKPWLLKGSIKLHMRTHGIGVEPKPAAADPEKPKRPYTRRQNKTAMGPNFCPGCGCNLRAVAAAMTL